MKIIASLAGCHRDRLGKFRTSVCVSTLFSKVRVAANSRCSLELFLFDLYAARFSFLLSLFFPRATTRKQRFSTRRDILGEKYFLENDIYIYIYIRFLDDRVPIHDGGTDRCDRFRDESSIVTQRTRGRAGKKERGREKEEKKTRER